VRLADTGLSLCRVRPRPILVVAARSGKGGRAL